jgi:hypothetical protein
MYGGATFEHETTSALCAACGIPLDSQYFDDSSVQNLPAVGEEVVLARFELPAQYCGVLEYFAQFTDQFAKDASRIATPNVEWRLLVNNHGLFPYMNLRQIINPWGFGSYQVKVRLDESSTLELVARGVSVSSAIRGQDPNPITQVGGRIMGRFWYNASYGDVVTHRH